ncbi:hypothetical protein ACFWAM_47325, partial [Rhodococcus jostii]
HISREGSVPLRRALIELGFGLRHNEPAAKRYAADLKQRGKPNRVIGCALAHRANRIDYALVWDRVAFDPGLLAARGVLTPTRPPRIFRSATNGGTLEGDEGPESKPQALWRTLGRGPRRTRPGTRPFAFRRSPHIAG